MAGAEHGARSPTRIHHGQSEKETSSENEQAQAPKALEGESPQEAYVAEVDFTGTLFRGFPSTQTRRISRRVFYFFSFGPIGPMGEST